MTSALSSLAEAIDVARGILPDGRDIASLTPAELIALNDQIGRGKRLAESVQAMVASEIQRQSRPGLGPDSLAKIQGFRNPTQFIAATMGTTTGDAARLVKVGDATTPRTLLSGDKAPARHPHVGQGLSDGRIGAQAASAIIAMLDRVAIRAGAEKIEQAEQLLVEQAAGLPLDALSKLILRAQAWLDPDGVEPREADLAAETSLTIRRDRSGMIVINGKFDPVSGAPVVTAIEGMVTAKLRAQRDTGPGGARESLRATSARTDEPATPLLDETTEAERRTIPQMQADAFVSICEHALGCAENDLPLNGVTVVVRMTLDTLREGTGTAQIDGIDAPISASAARKLAWSASVIPCVLGGDSEILDWGRERRLYSRSQKLALGERDGGCVGCGLPPQFTKVHHIRWWMRDAGPTDLDNGVLLCESCHHRIHDNGWDIRVEGTGRQARVWLIPPAFVDPERTPRLGGRARYDFAA
ncbi:HNH endonuclease signature motif containing protein [Microbacterium ureisolvens]|uniref:DUF222 domain-containing protein n=1 Tax=Microbacterium ureisolvens TaxID=2781186 RepID=A0ABS7I2Z9_9MICO|nr:HNH endonuclease signature motif containing protein [Microbacterium ureisolvens]MBW9110969.1 DUF222 domain-containing protein [Microbacterium ureisolvens]